MRPTRILVVEDEYVISRYLEIALERLGYEVVCAVSTAEDAISKTDETRPDLILMDISLDGQQDGIEAATLIRSRHDIPIIFVTAVSDQEVLDRARLTGPFGYIVKPVRNDTLHGTVQMALYKHEMERDLRAGEERYRSLFEQSREAICIVAEDGTFVNVNQAFVDLCGYDGEKLLKMCAWTLCANLDEQALWRHDIARCGSVKDYQLQIRRADGELRHCLLSAALSKGKNGRVRYQCIFRDVTEQRNIDEAVKRAYEELEKRVEERTADLVVANERLHREIKQRTFTERELLKSRQSYKELYEEANGAKEIYRSLLSSSPDAIVIYDMQGRVQYVNELFTKIFGWSLQEVLGSRLDFVPQSEEARTREAVLELIKHGVPRGEFESRRYTKDGRLLDVILSGSRYHDPRGNPAGIFVIIRDVTDRRQTERSLRESEEKYRTILESMEEGYYEVDLRGYMLFCNDSLAKMLGYNRSELIGKNNRAYADAANARKMYKIFSRVFATGETASIAGWELLTKDGEPRLIEASVSLMHDAEGHPKAFRGVVRDMTDRQRLEDQLAQAQKMEAIGTLAGGIAHDFNNILYAILGYSELALDETPPESDTAQHLGNVLEAANRARDLVNQILIFSRQRERERKPVRVAPMIKEIVKFLRASIPSTIDIRYSSDPDLGMILADPTQIHQVVMNLCTNSAHAMREKGGIMTLELRKVHFSPDDALDLEIQPGHYLGITVSDTGHGIAPEILSRIFEPYFTTKKPGEGTGLGLSVVHGIVRGHEGALAVRSQAGEGTDFHVYLPMIEEAKDGSSAEEYPTLTGTERILLVDDEQPIVDMSRRILERLGYDVKFSTDSLEALGLFESEPDNFDLIITDMTMPNLTGIDLASEVLRVRPDTPIILCTGFSELVTEERAKEMGIAALVTKPILKRRMAETIRKVLQKKES